MSSLYTDSERALARTAIEMHSGDSLRVLVGGLGLGYTVHETLQSNRVARVEVVELLPQVIDWLARGLIPLSTDLQNEPRLVVTQGDAYGRLAGPPDDLLDVILIDVDHSPDERLGSGSRSRATWCLRRRGGRPPLSTQSAAMRFRRRPGSCGVWNRSRDRDVFFPSSRFEIFRLRGDRIAVPGGCAPSSSGAARRPCSWARRLP